MEAAYIEVKSAGGRQQVELGHEALTVGRHADNKVVLTDAMASRFHCVIEEVDGLLQVRDLNSSNGTRLNGKNIVTAVVNGGDVITIGNTDIRVVFPQGQSEAKAPAPVEIIGDQEDQFGAYDVLEVEEAPVEEEGIPADPVTALQKTANSIANKPFNDLEITIVNARGGIAFPADGPSKKRDTVDAVRVFRLTLLICFRKGASDIHIEPKQDDYLIRVRTDGSMVDLVRLTKEVGGRVTAMVKVLCDLDIAQRNKIQEGHFSARAPGGEGKDDRRVDYRCSFAPSVFGQKLVIRILDASNAPSTVDDLQLPAWMAAEIRTAVEADSGMVLACGPTGSGKTTSLYAMLRTINLGERNITTIEDPVEIQIEGVTQLPVNEGENKTFAALLKTVLRQDPDVILIGEIRDPETAKIAMQGAITGHLVLSTVHTKDTIGTVFRLLDLGCEPYMVAQGLQMVLAQRLVRNLCPVCKSGVTPTTEQLATIEKICKPVELPKKIFQPRGCAQCLKTGFAGRRAIFELLSVNAEIREAILQPTPSMLQIAKAAAQTKFTSLAYAGYDLVSQGVVAFDEIEKVVGK